MGTIKMNVILLCVHINIVFRLQAISCFKIQAEEYSNWANEHNIWVASWAQFFLIMCNFVFFIGICEVGKYLKELKQLTLDQTKVTDHGFVYVSRHLPKLVSLGVEGCKITDRGLVKASGSLTNLEELDLGSNLITDEGIKQAVVHLKGLTDMTLTSCNSITDASIECVINHLPCLTHLGIEGCLHISEEAVERLRETAKSAISFF